MPAHNSSSACMQQYLDSLLGGPMTLAGSAGENSIMVVGGANQADWQLSEPAREVCRPLHHLLTSAGDALCAWQGSHSYKTLACPRRLSRTLLMLPPAVQLLGRAGAILLQREIPERVNTEVAQVWETLTKAPRRDVKQPDCWGWTHGRSICLNAHAPHLQPSLAFIP